MQEGWAVLEAMSGKISSLTDDDEEVVVGRGVVGETAGGRAAVRPQGVLPVSLAFGQDLCFVSILTSPAGLGRSGRGARICWGLSTLLHWP